MIDRMSSVVQLHLTEGGKVEPFELLYDDRERQGHFGQIEDMRFYVAMDVIRHCALVSAKESGEDKAGRQALRLLEPKEVAHRALDIATELVDEAQRRDLLRKSTVTMEERAAYAGMLRGIASACEFDTRGKDENWKEKMKSILDRVT